MSMQFKNNNVCYFMITSLHLFQTKYNIIIRYLYLEHYFSSRHKGRKKFPVHVYYNDMYLYFDTAAKKFNIHDSLNRERDCGHYSLLLLNVNMVV